MICGELDRPGARIVPGGDERARSDERRMIKPLAQSELQNQDRHWSQHAEKYDEVFLDPYLPGVENPLLPALDSIADAGRKTVADLGCGTGPLLPFLAERFERVYALDFAAGMIERARERLQSADGRRVTFLQRPMDQLEDLDGQLDVAVAVNSLVMPDIRIIDKTLRAIRACLKPGGQFLGIVPSIDAIIYHTMLLVDKALDRGLPPGEAERIASLQIERRYYDFAFGRFRFRGPAPEVLAALRNRASFRQGRVLRDHPQQGPLSLGREPGRQR